MEKQFQKVAETASDPSHWTTIGIIAGIFGIVVKGLRYLITAEVTKALEIKIEELNKKVEESNRETNEKIDKLIHVIISNNGKK